MGVQIISHQSILTVLELTIYSWKRTSPYDTQVPTINQENAIPGSEPTETLKKFRSDKVLRPARKQQGKVRLQFKVPI